MPQLWLTYGELAGELGCDVEQARSVSISAGWTRKHSGDGFTRVMMPPDMMASFFVKAASRGSVREGRGDGWGEPAVGRWRRCAGAVIGP